jgi:hypothetical protein
MRPISQVRKEIRDVLLSIGELETEVATYYQAALEVSLEWQKRFASDATKQDSEMFRDYVFALRYATLVLLTVKDELKRTNYFTRIENWVVDPDTGVLYDWRIATLNGIRDEAHRDIVDWNTPRLIKISVGDMMTLEEA